VPASESPREPPLFSILLPSRNRLALLKFAVESILAQSVGSWEIVVSDNCSDEDYRGYLALLGNSSIRRNPSMRMVRTPRAVPVTDNWNNALAHATGRYILMLGDDDALTPGCLARLETLIAQHGEPDVIFAAAYHYCYPGAMPTAKPDGYLATVAPLPILEGRTTPAVLAGERSRFYAEQGLKFRNLFGFNSQYMVWKKSFIDSLAHLGPFFQSPYPDYYASLVTMRLAERIVVDPEPAMVIGISPKSFGYYFGTNQVAAGNAMLGLTEAYADAVRSVLPDADHALGLPGDPHYRNWLLANLTVYKNLPDAFTQGVDLRRYRRIQILWMAHHYQIDPPADRQTITETVATLRPQEQRFFNNLSAQFEQAKTSGQPLQALHDKLFQSMNIYGGARVQFHELGPHTDVRDALIWLSVRRAPLLRALQFVGRRLRARERRAPQPGRRWSTSQFFGALR
jgi:glycosyltransferase involved in cell wall biosynthesis